MQYVRGVFLSDAPKDADETSVLNVLLTSVSPPGVPAGVLRRCGVPAEPSLITWGSRSPNPRRRDVRGGATRPPRPVVCVTFDRRDRPALLLSLPPETSLKVEGLGECQEKAKRGPGLDSARSLLEIARRPQHTHLPVGVAGHGDATSHVGEGRGFPVLCLPRLGLGCGLAYDWICTAVNPGRMGRRK